MTYRTRTYIAGDWTGDADLIQYLQDKNESDYWNLSFVDAHDYTQADDNDLYCSIKRSLQSRLDISKTFVLIVGNKTKSLRKGDCSYCKSYTGWCRRGNGTSHKSYIEYECDYAVRNRNEVRIIVIYNYANIDKDKCPESIKNYGKHINGYYYGIDGKCYWNYSAIKNAINGN